MEAQYEFENFRIGPSRNRIWFADTERK
jgi:hypothetical protein